MFSLGVRFRSNSVETVTVSYFMSLFFVVDSKTYVNFNLQFMLHVTLTVGFTSNLVYKCCNMNRNDMLVVIAGCMQYVLLVCVWVY
jgi:hypothetical protein